MPQSKNILFVQKVIFGIFVFGWVVGCGSAQLGVKQREAAVTKTGLVCKFIQQNDSSSEEEIGLNLQMAQDCDPERPFSISSYMPQSDVRGVFFCCSTDPKKKMAAAAKEAVSSMPAVTTPSSSSSAFAPMPVPLPTATPAPMPTLAPSTSLNAAPKVTTKMGKKGSVPKTVPTHTPFDADVVQ